MSGQMTTASEARNSPAIMGLKAAEFSAWEQARRRLNYANQFHEIWLGLACLGLIFSRWILQAHFSYFIPALVGALFLISVSFPRISRRSRDLAQLRQWATFYMGLEIVVFSLLMYALGIYSIVWIFYLLSIQYGYFILPQNSATGLALFAMAAYTGIAVLGRNQPFPGFAFGTSSYAELVVLRLIFFAFFALANRRITGAMGARSEAMDQANHSLRESGKSLQHQHDELEREVRKRTHDLKQAYENTEKLNEHLRRMNRLQMNFIASVSHELRTPLTSIRSFAELLRDYPDETPATQREFLEIILSESRRLERLICDLLDLATLETGGMRFHFAVFDPRELLQTAADLMRSLFTRKQLDLELEIPEELPQMTGDRDRLMQVLTNLLHNALKFTERGGARIGARCHSDALEFYVADTGCGVPAGDREKIFDRFHQGAGPLSDKPAGTGLGLSICRQIIEHHGGHVWVESQENSGSCFRCLLPLVQPVAEWASPSPRINQHADAAANVEV